MEHSLAHTQLVRPWRTATVVASLIALAELAVLVVLTLPDLGREVASGVQTQATERLLAPVKRQPAPARTEAAKPAVPPPLPRGETSVLVLNGNGIRGAAAQAADQIRARGYLIASTGNAPRTDYTRTLVMYRAGREAEARRLAKDIGGAHVAPLDGIKAAELMGAQVAVVLGNS